MACRCGSSLPTLSLLPARKHSRPPFCFRLYIDTGPSCRKRRRDSRVGSSNAALMFSAGVDSYYSLLCGSKPNVLVSVHGFDIALNDTLRMASLRTALDDTARAHGCIPIVVRTNLREHPSVGKAHLWDRSRERIHSLPRMGWRLITSGTTRGAKKGSPRWPSIKWRGDTFEYAGGIAGLPSTARVARNV